MNDPKILVLISKHIEGNETSEEQSEFSSWRKESENNQLLFLKIKNMWMDIKEEPTPFLKKFSRNYLTKVVIQKTLGNLVGFAVGILVTNSFTHYVTERKSIKNLFGLAHRKQIQVNDTPEWVQYTVSVLLGFIVLEMINHFFETKKHVLIFDFIKNKIRKD